jgi:hypothetical protein
MRRRSDEDLLIVLGKPVVPGQEIDRMIGITIDINFKTWGAHIDLSNKGL